LALGTVTTDVLTFLRSIFSREGNPDYIVTDNGPERGISHLRTSVYHPQCNGAVERWNRVLKETILTAEHMQKDWKTTVTDFLQNYRATPHNTTGVSPSELLHNRKMKTKVNIFPSSEKSRKYTTVQETVRQKQEKSKQYTDKRRGAKTPTFKPGDMVRVKRPDHVRKGSSRFTSPLSVDSGEDWRKYYVLSDNKRWNAARLSRVLLFNQSETCFGPRETRETPLLTAQLKGDLFSVKPSRGKSP
uniref:Integrase catalytic domain-containing protein n=1 Tax=Xiphophorus maculatus TaxID=8083 RepID=A0A3B5Q910_XIPMA